MGKSSERLFLISEIDLATEVKRMKIKKNQIHIRIISSENKILISIVDLIVDK